MPMDTSCATLEALARGVALHPTLRLRDGEPGGGWAIDPVAGCIYADPTDREDLPEGEVYGLVCHEAAHAAVTRYPWLVPASLLEEPGVLLLLNALEDCRIEAWMAARLPGTVPWITAYNNRLLPASGGQIASTVPFLQFCLAIVHLGWRGAPPAGLDTEVLDALERTRDARERIQLAAPPTSAATTADGYRGSRVEQVFRATDRGPVSDWEAAIRLSAASAWAITYTEVLPVFRELTARTPPDDVRALSASFLERVGSGWRPGRPTGLGSPSASPSISPSSASSRTRWALARSEVQPQIDRLVRVLEETWRPTTRTRWTSARRVGQRVDLRAVMQRAARPDHVEVWRDKTVPDRVDPVFVLALDLSGSMVGTAIEQAFRGVVMLAEALERLGLRFALWGYQDEPFCFKDLHESLAGARSRLSDLPLEVVGCRPGGHNRPEHNWDGPVLTELIDGLSTSPSSTVVLMVSDGAPSGPGLASERLHQAIRSIPPSLTLIGIGLGQAGAQVADYYPRTVRCALADFPAALGRCLQDALHAR